MPVFYYEGYQAYELGYSINDCPYIFDWCAEQDWLDGYMDAYGDYEGWYDCWCGHCWMS